MFLDIALGVMIGMGTAAVFGWEQVAVLVVGGIVSALLPDVDFIIHRVWKKRDAHFDYLHRTLLHRPLVYIPVGAVVVGWFGSVPLVVVFALASLWHFVHDSTGVGFGVQWLWPFSDDWIGWRHRGLAQCAGRDDVPRICRVPRAKVDAYVRAQTPPRVSWIAQTYFRPSRTALVEYGALALVCIGVAVWWIVW